MPEDCKKISKDEVETIFIKIVESWKHWQDVIFLRHGCDMLGALAGASGVFMNQHYRTKLRLPRHFGFLSTYLPNIFVPAVFSIAAHKLYISREIYSWHPKKSLQELQAKAVAFQVCGGVIQPAILAPLSTFLYATRHFTARIPYPFEKPKEFARFYWKITKPILSTIGIGIGVHAVATAAVIYWEFEEFNDLQKRLLEDVPEDEKPPPHQIS